MAKEIDQENVIFEESMTHLKYPSNEEEPLPFFFAK
jgi:hypothetical protein